MILSTHHIDEVASLFGRVAILDRGGLLVEADTDALRSRGVEVVGAAGAVERFVADAGLEVLNERRLGGTLAAVAYGELADERRRAATAAGLELGPLPLQDLFVHLTGDRTLAAAPTGDLLSPSASPASSPSWRRARRRHGG